MLIAHLPAGYVLTKTMCAFGLNSAQTVSPRSLMTAGLLASVAPDLDMLYFYTIDNHQHLHHGYWTHIPLFWAVTLGCLALVCRAMRSTRGFVLTAVVAGNLLLHCFLDSVNAGIRWFEPFSHRYTVFFEVPARFPYTYLNFLLHWTFALEILIWLLAAALYFRATRHNTLLQKTAE